MNGLPGSAGHADANGFLSRRAFIAYLEDYARSYRAPILEGVTVTGIERRNVGFDVTTTSGTWHARNVVLATGDAAVPHTPLTAPSCLAALHAAGYRRPSQVPDGRVLVVGAGASGQQLALELREAGRDVVIAAGRHSRAPRRYRGRDIFEWLQLLGDFDRTVDELPDLEAAKRVPPFPLSGADDGQDLGLDRLVEHGVAVTGRLLAFDSDHAVFAPDLHDNTAAADGRLAKLLRRIDSHPLAQDAATEPVRTVELPPAPRTIRVRDLAALVWATGYRRSYQWLHVPGVLDKRGEIIHRRGVTPAPGLYVLGLAYQSRRSSHFIGGVGRDAETVARLIAADTAAARAPISTIPRPLAAALMVRTAHG
jgi:putative flavoprotein involved in K+ transport